jgi:hypothetical protein
MNTNPIEQTLKTWNFIAETSQKHLPVRRNGRDNDCILLSKRGSRHF